MFISPHPMWPVFVNLEEFATPSSSVLNLVSELDESKETLFCHLGPGCPAYSLTPWIRKTAVPGELAFLVRLIGAAVRGGVVPGSRGHRLQICRLEGINRPPGGERQ